MLPWAEEIFSVKWNFQWNNDTNHMAKSTKKMFADNSINVLVWRSSSPDINPIEHVWDDVKNPKRAVSLKNITNMATLFEKVKLAWEAIKA